MQFGMCSMMKIPVRKEFCEEVCLPKRKGKQSELIPCVWIADESIKVGEIVEWTAWREK